MGTSHNLYFKQCSSALYLENYLLNLTFCNSSETATILFFLRVPTLRTVTLPSPSINNPVSIQPEQMRTFKMYLLLP